MVKLVYLLIPLAATYYTYTYGRWAMQKGYRKGGFGLFILAALVMALSIYSTYLRTGY